jgi:hypothetical protein
VAVDGRKKAQKAQKENGGVETVVTNPVKVSTNAKLSFLCAFCVFSWPTAFSGLTHPWHRLDQKQLRSSGDPQQNQPGNSLSF